MRARPSIAFLLLRWLLGLAVPAAAISLAIWVGAALLWPLVALAVAAMTVAGAMSRTGGARWAVLVPGLAGCALAYYGAVTQAQGPAAWVYYAAAGLWLVTACVAMLTKGGGAE